MFIIGGREFRGFGGRRGFGPPEERRRRRRERESEYNTCLIKRGRGSPFFPIDLPLLL